MAKVVQFLEIGNLPKSQLNPCRSRKLMIKNLIFANLKKRITFQVRNAYLSKKSVLLPGKSGLKYKVPRPLRT